MALVIIFEPPCHNSSVVGKPGVRNVAEEELCPDPTEEITYKAVEMPVARMSSNRVPVP
jgi:hypothetical protein